MEDQRKDHGSSTKESCQESTRSDEPLNMSFGTTATPTPANLAHGSPMEEHLDLEKDPNVSLPITSSKNAKWYHSAFQNVAATVGVGVLSLPYAMSQLGWGPGVAVLILSWVITLYTLWQMIEMHEMVEGRRFNRYVELGQAAFGQNLGLYIILPQQLLVEISVCIVYMVTGGQSLQTIHNLLRPNKCREMSIRYFILIFASSEFVLSQLKNFGSIAGVSLVAAIMSVSYSTIAWVASAMKEVQHRVDYNYRARSYGVIYDFFSGLGMMAFAYADHDLISMPSTLEKPSKKSMWKGTIVAYIIVAFCYFPVALLGYGIFGNTVGDNVLMTLVQPKPLVFVANMIVVINLVGSYQVYAMPVFEMIECVMIRRCHFTPSTTLGFIIRCTFVAFTMGVAIALPYFEALLSFFGGFAFAPIMYFIPCIIWLILKRPRRFSLSWWTNWVCIVAGVLLMILAPIGGLEQLIYAAKNYHPVITECKTKETENN